MSFEIERKFLVCGDAWRTSVTGHRKIRQAYLDSDGKTSVRVRIIDDRVATLTIKSRPAALRRLEFEYPIPVLEAEALIALRRGALIEKVRHVVPCGELKWEIDVFSDENAGLVIAEIELPDENCQIELPAWVGTEITGQEQYYNGALAQSPFSSWKRRHEGRARVSKE